jgi:hypothetical protein
VKNFPSIKEILCTLDWDKAARRGKKTARRLRLNQYASKLAQFSKNDVAQEIADVKESDSTVASAVPTWRSFCVIVSIYLTAQVPQELKAHTFMLLTILFSYGEYLLYQDGQKRKNRLHLLELHSIRTEDVT